MKNFLQYLGITKQKPKPRQNRAMPLGAWSRMERNGVNLRELDVTIARENFDSYPFVYVKQETEAQLYSQSDDHSIDADDIIWWRVKTLQEMDNKLSELRSKGYYSRVFACDADNTPFYQPFDEDLTFWQEVKKVLGL